MQTEPTPSPISEKTHELVGRACAAWAHFEALTEVAVWGVLGIDQSLGRIITWPKDIKQLWQLLLSEAPKKHSESDIAALKSINKRLVDVIKDRNIIVHGLITAAIQTDKSYDHYDIADKGTFTVIPAWTVFKGEHAGKRFVISENSVGIILENIQKLSGEMAVFNKSNNYHSQYSPDSPADQSWPTPL